MVKCSKCGNKIIFLPSKYKLENDCIFCTACFDKLNRDKRRDSENKIIMQDYILKYLSNKDIDIHTCILALYKTENINFFLYRHPLEWTIEYLQTLLDQTNSSIGSNLSSHEMDDILQTKKTLEEGLNFLNDLGKLYRLFVKKGVKTNYIDILSLFAEAIEQNLNKESDKILIPVYKRISKRLGKNISTENVIKEFMKMPLNIEHSFVIISKLLDKFELEYDKDEVEKIIEEVHQDIDLEEFEQDLGSSQRIDIGDFEKLKGYEFEGYLKGLFNLLGYTVVQTSLSGDQGADLIISKDGEKIVVQAKKYNEKVSNKAVQEIVAAKNHYKAHKAIVVTNSSFTKSAIDLALSNDVELWDGLKLRNIIQNLKTKKKEKGLQSEKSLTLQKGKYVQKIKIPCPFCEEEFEYKIDIREGVNFETECPNCGIIIRSSSKSKIWNCEYCSHQFDTKAEAEKHEKTCKKPKK